MGTRTLLFLADMGSFGKWQQVILLSCHVGEKIASYRSNWAQRLLQLQHQSNLLRLLRHLL